MSNNVSTEWARPLPGEKLKLEEIPGGGLKATLIKANGEPLALHGVGMALWHIKHNNLQIPLEETPEGLKPTAWGMTDKLNYPVLNTQKLLDFYLRGPGSQPDWVRAIPDDAELPADDLLNRENRKRMISQRKYSLATRSIIERETIYTKEDEFLHLFQFEKHYLDDNGFFRWVKLNHPEFALLKGTQKITQENALKHLDHLTLPNTRLFETITPGSWRIYLEDSPYLFWQTPDYTFEDYLLRIFKLKPTPATGEKLWSLLKQAHTYYPEGIEFFHQNAPVEWETQVVLNSFGSTKVPFRKRHGNSTADVHLCRPETLVSLGKKIHFGSPVTTGKIEKDAAGAGDFDGRRGSRRFSTENEAFLWRNLLPEVIASGFISMTANPKREQTVFTDEELPRMLDITRALVEAEEGKELVKAFTHKVFPISSAPKIAEAVPQKSQCAEQLGQWLASNL